MQGVFAMNVKLIVTYDPAHIESSREKVENLIRETGAKPKFLESKHDGIFMIDVSKPKEVVRKLRAISKKNRELLAKLSDTFQ